MSIQITYNEKIDQFTNDITLESRLKRYINNNFYPIFIISTLAKVYLFGESIRDLIDDKVPKELDFLVLGNENLGWILKVLDKYNISYTKNKFGGFKFCYNGIFIDLWLSNDLLSSIKYNADSLFYDISNNNLISIDDFSKNELKTISEENNISNERDKKLLVFEENFRKKCKF